MGEVSRGGSIQFLHPPSLKISQALLIQILIVCSSWFPSMGHSSSFIHPFTTSLGGFAAPSLHLFRVYVVQVDVR